MADHGTAIEWTQAPGFKGETWNPVTGCDRVSPGCAHCYALELAARLKGMGQKRYQRDGDPKTSGPGFGLTLHPDKLEEPLRWRKPRMVFVNSMSDLFHEEIPDEYIAKVFAVMARAPQHIFQVLTKRPERMHEWVLRVAHCDPEYGWLTHNGDVPSGWTAPDGNEGTGVVIPDEHGWPLPNVWLGVSIENRRFVHRADLLRQTPAAVRFISAEPLLGPLVGVERGGQGEGKDAEACTPGRRGCSGANPSQGSSVSSVESTSGTGGTGGCDPNHTVRPEPGRLLDSTPKPASLDLTDIDWLIVGGESGPNHRRIDPQWVRDLRDACWEIDNGRGDAIAFFFKQWGGRRAKEGGRELDGRTWDEWPSALEAVPA